MKNHYQTLGLQSDATDEEIKIAYRKLAWKYHPDRNKGNVFFAEKFKEIHEAYMILSNPDKRKNFDILSKLRIHESEYIAFTKNGEEEKSAFAKYDIINSNIDVIVLFILTITLVAILTCLQ